MNDSTETKSAASAVLSFFDWMAQLLNMRFERERFPGRRQLLQARIVFIFQVSYIFAWFVFIIIYSLFGGYLSAVFCLIFGILPSVIGIRVLKRSSDHMSAGLLSNLGSATALFMITHTTGMATSAVMPWLTGVLIGSYLQMGKKGGNLTAGYIIFLILLVGIMGYFNVGNWYELPFEQDSREYIIFNIFNFAFVSLMIAILVVVHVVQFELGYKVLQESEKKIKILNEQLYQKAHTDELTDVYNRRALLELAEKEFKVTSRRRQTVKICSEGNLTGAPEAGNGKDPGFKKSRQINDYIGCFSLAILDLDHFKRINDSYGHDVGDKVLRAFSLTMKQNFRDTDIFGRYGGEEFLVIFPDTCCDPALIALSKFRDNLAKTEIRFSENQKLKVTFSAGLTEYTAADKTIDQLIKRADDALYKAKKQGRNRVVCL